MRIRPHNVGEEDADAIVVLGERLAALLERLVHLGREHATQVPVRIFRKG